MKRAPAIVAIAIAIGMLSTALTLLCAATQEPIRLVVAAPLFLGGVALAVLGTLALRRQRDLSPENLSGRITRLALRGNGEVTLSQVVAELRAPNEVAIAALNLLERRGLAQREHAGEDAREVYVFPGLKSRHVRRECPYCGTEFSVKKALHRCPNCGGDLELERE